MAQSVFRLTLSLRNFTDPSHIRTFAPPGCRLLSVHMPVESERVRALFAWFGHGTGLWSGYPAYEEVPEKLLMAFETSALLATLEGTSLTTDEAAGAARYFAGWYFRTNRRGEADQMSPALRKLLLEAGSNTTDAYRLARAQRAFAGR